MIQIGFSRRSGAQGIVGFVHAVETAFCGPGG